MSSFRLGATLERIPVSRQHLGPADTAENRAQGTPIGCAKSSEIVPTRR